MKKLKSPVYEPFTAKEIIPGGWLHKQLLIQAKGLSGNLDRVWPDIRDSKWIGGSAEGWERVPYWLDGFIPLAWLLRDEDMQKRARTYIDAILERQEEDGWICPCNRQERHGYDVWAAFLICKVLTVYGDCSGDERVEPAIEKALRNLNRHIETDTLFNWGMCRWYECLIPIYWLYERKPQDWLLGLASKLEAEGLSYEKLFENWQFTEPVRQGEWSYLTHVVNLAMALKSEALMGRIHGKDGNAFARRALELLQKYHGMATGHFTGDECLAGDSPVQGSECCSVVEAMYSYEWLIALTGDPFWQDMLEKTAYNALPATLSPDMWTHQYDQQTNQVQCTYLPEDKIVFKTNGGESHLFGLEPNFGCCTANFGQGFPKFALSCLMRTKTGIAVTAIAPVKVQTRINGVEVVCEVATDYPFRDSADVILTAKEPVSMELELRIPGFRGRAFVDGQAVPTGKPFRLELEKVTERRTSLKFDFDAYFEKRPKDMVCVWRGPLLYALPIAEKWIPHEFIRDQVERKYPYCDYELVPLEKWNYGYRREAFALERHPIGETPFSPDEPPVSLCADLCEIDWRMENGICKAEPENRKPLGADQRKKLIPYGCTNLRMTETPLI